MVKKKKSNNVNKYTMSSNHKFSKNISKILDILGETSKNTYNHYLFCYKFYLLYKDKVYEEVFLNIIKTNKYYKDNIDQLIHSTFKKYYDFYQSDFKNYIQNNNILYGYIKNLKLNINHYNFIKIYNNLIKHCIGLDKLIVNTPNLFFLYEQNILSILISFYYYKYYNVKNGLINKIPIKVDFNDKFKSHVMSTEKPTQFIVKNDYKKILNNFLNKDIQLGSEQNFISRLVYSTMKFDKTSSDLIVNILPKAHEAISSYYALKQKGLKANKPKYIKEDFYSIIFCGKTIKLEDKNINKKQIRLLYGDFIINNWKKYFNEELEEKLILKIKKPTLLNNKNITLKQIEIKKISFQNYKIYYKVDKPKLKEVNTENVKINETISIDLGLKNLFTIHDPDGKQMILKGGHLICINEYYNKKIGYIQCKREKEKDKSKKNILNDEIKLLNDMRLRKINGKMNEIVKKIKSLYPNKKIIVIGYNEGWKTKINLGHNTNRKFYQIYSVYFILVPIYIGTKM